MKRIRSIILTTVILGTLVGCGEEFTRDQTRSFIKYYGTYQTDAGWDIQRILSGGYAIAGSMVPDTTSKPVLIITDDAGNQVSGSPFVFGGDLSGAGRAVLVLDDGYLLGGTVSDTATDGESQTDWYVVRADMEGNELWSIQLGGEENDVLNHMANRREGGFVLAGKRSTNEQEDVWVVMVDENGNQLFDFLGNTLDDDDEANYILPTNDGYLVSCTYDDVLLDGTDLYVALLDSACNSTTTLTLGTEDYEFARTIRPYNSGYVAMCYTENTTSSLSEVRLYTFGLAGQNFENTDLLATIPVAGTDFKGEDLTVLENGTIVVVGTQEQNENQDAFLMFILENVDSAQGYDLLGTEVFGGSGNQTGVAIEQTYDGGLIFTGNNNVGGNNLITLIKTNAEGKF